VPYAEIPGLPKSTVPGHAGEFVAVRSVNALFMRGRFHPYEGYSMQEVTMPIRMMTSAGVRTLIVTNAAGGVNTAFVPGDLMVIEDHISFAENPLQGVNMDAFGSRFPDMSRAYDRELIDLAHSVAGDNGLTLRQGVYFYMRGPSFETPAEIRALRTLGADAVGMSTVPEVIVARHGGMRVLGISCISNMAAGILNQPLSHDEVIETGEKVKDAFTGLIDGLLRKL
jgi:purine-nucleoside phosphorylase